MKFLRVVFLFILFILFFSLLSRLDQKDRSQFNSTASNSHAHTMPFIVSDDAIPTTTETYGTPTHKGADDRFQKVVRAPSKVGSADFRTKTPSASAAIPTLFQLQSVVIKKDLIALHFLLGHPTNPINPSTVFANGTVGLHLAAELGWRDGVKAFFLAGVDPNVTDADGLTPLHHAVVSGDMPTIAMLLECGANINSQDKEGDTALHFAIRDSKLDVVHFLIHRGANARIQNDCGETPYRLAFDLREEAICRLLQDRCRSNRNSSRPAPRTSPPPFFSFV